MELPKRLGTCDMRDLIELERILDFELPEDYKDFLCKNNGGNFHTFGNWAGIIIPDLNEKVMLDESYGFGLGDEYESIDIVQVNKFYEGEIPPNSLVFAQDPGGNMFLLICKGVDSGVYYWDHSHFYKKSSDVANTYKLNDSFTGFLRMIEYEND